MRDLLTISATATELISAKAMLIDLQCLIDKKIDNGSSGVSETVAGTQTAIEVGSSQTKNQLKVIQGRIVDNDDLLRQLHEAQEDLALYNIANRALQDGLEQCYQTMHRSSKLIANFISEEKM